MRTINVTPPSSPQRTKRELGRVFVAFAAVIVAAEVLARVVVGLAAPAEVTWYDESSQIRIEALTQRDPDLVIVGTSMAWQGLVPSEFERLGVAESVYNLGLPGGIPVVSGPWATDVVVEKSSPAIVVWGLGPLDFSSSYGDANQGAYVEAFETRPGWLAETDRTVSGYSALVRWRRTLRSPSLLFGEAGQNVHNDLHEAGEIIGPDGERLDFRLNVTTERAEEVQRRVRDLDLDLDDLTALTEAVRKLESQGITVVIVELPVPQRTIELMPNRSDDYDRFVSTIEAIGEELDLPVFRSSSWFNDEDFVDFTHLDADAASAFSADVAAQMLAMGLGQ